MYYLGALWIGALFGWLACSMLVRRSLEIENSVLRREIEEAREQVKQARDARDLAASRAYDQGKRDATHRIL